MSGPIVGIFLTHTVDGHAHLTAHESV